VRADPVAETRTRRRLDVGDSLLAALALVLVIEGLLPLLSPGSWRQAFQRALQLKDGQLRFLGMLSVAAGVVLLLVSSM
jgi:uncharacterized protein YjeT (DUF2065 family)